MMTWTLVDVGLYALLAGVNVASTITAPSGNIPTFIWSTPVDVFAGPPIVIPVPSIPTVSSPAGKLPSTEPVEICIVSIWPAIGDATVGCSAMSVWVAANAAPAGESARIPTVRAAVAIDPIAVRIRRG
jgi:hypothetical protein